MLHFEEYIQHRDIKPLNIFFIKDNWYLSDFKISRWEDKSGCRNFKTLEEHNNSIVDSINSVVGQEDILYHLGDWSFGGVENVFRFRERIICQNVHIILGNHDENIYKNRDNCHEVFESVNSYLELKIDDDLIVLSHWPMKIWNNYHTNR